MADSLLQKLRTRVKEDKPILWNFLGDSIAHGALHTWGWRAYVELFEERVRYQLGRRNDLVINGACSGSNIGSVANGLEHRCLRFHPDMVTIAVGMNDAVAGGDGVASFEKNYLAVIDRLRRQTAATVFLQTPNTIDWANAATRSALPEYAEAIRRIGRQADVPVCDHYAVWERYQQTEGMQVFYLLNDPIHPNADGHRMLANTLLHWLGYGPMARKDPLENFPVDPS